MSINNEKLQAFNIKSKSQEEKNSNQILGELIVVALVLQ